MIKLTKTLARSFAKGKPKIHRQDMPLYEFVPIYSYSSYVAPSATLVGEARISEQAYILGNTVVRGDLNRAHVGSNSLVMENCSISTVHRHPDSAEIMDCDIGDDVVIAPGCSLISCQVDELTYIGANSVICEGAEIGKDVFIGPNSVVPPNRKIPDGQVWAGNPVRFIRNTLKADKAAFIELRHAIFNDIRVTRREEVDTGAVYLSKCLSDFEEKVKL